MITDEVSRICTLVRITRRDAVVMGITDLDVDLVIDGVTYATASGYKPTAYEQDASLSVGNADISGLFEAAGFSMEDVVNRVYDYAQIDIYIYDWYNQQIVRQLGKGWWGDVVVKEGRFTASFTSLAQLLRQNYGRTYTAACDAEFGSDRCGVNLASYQTTATVQGVISQRVIQITGSHTTDIYKNGRLTWTQGSNTGDNPAVRSNTGGTIELLSPARFPILMGDRLTLTQGCEKSYTACEGYSNTVNFRGFPNIPTKDDVYQSASFNDLELEHT